MGISGTPTYTTLAHVKRILRTAQNKLNFSNTFRDLRRESGIGDLANVTLGSGYSGNERFSIEFSSTTEFEVFRGNIEDGVVSVGTGNVSSLFTASDNSISIAVSDWTSPFDATTVFSLYSLVDMSDDDGNLFIVEGERYVDALARLVYSPRIDVGAALEEALIFSAHVPSIVDIATSRYAAFLIYSSVFVSETDDIEQAQMFEDQAESLIKILVSRLGKTIKAGPQWKTRVPVFPDTKAQFDEVGTTEGKAILMGEYGIGIDNVEEGLREWKKNIGQTLLTA